MLDRSVSLEEIIQLIPPQANMGRMMKVFSRVIRLVMSTSILDSIRAAIEKRCTKNYDGWLVKRSYTILR